MMGQNPETFNSITMDKFARKCDITNKGMNEGWYCECLDTYIKNEADAINFVNNNTYADLECAYNDDFIYYTEWDAEDEEDEWYDEDGNLYEN